MKILLTGGTGLLGRNIIECLLEGNHEITLLLRDPTKYKKQDKKITKVKGDVLNLDSILDAIEKCECVIHAAADTSQHHLNILDFKVNTQGTKNIVLACKKKNIKKLIHVGSAGFFGYGSKENPGNENATIKYPSNQSLYLMSKLHAQQEITAYGKSNSVITIHPTFMIGAHDYGPSSGKIILMAMKKIVFCPPGGKNFVHVKDVANACISAIDSNNHGANYIIGNENLSYYEFFKLIQKKYNRKSIIIRIPSFVFYIMGLLGNVFRFMGFKTELSLANMKILMINNYFKNDKSLKELNLKYSPTEKAINDAVNFFKP